MKKTTKGIISAVAAAALYSINSPCSKLLLTEIPPTLLAGILYIGAGLCMAVLLPVSRLAHIAPESKPISRAQLPYIIGMIVLDIAAPILLMFGLRSSSAASASLLNNFEIVATALIALALFREKISPRLWCGISFVTVACVVLSFEAGQSISLSGGSLLILLAAVCWGLENNCTRRLSDNNPMMIVLLKGVFSGTGSLLIGIFSGERLTDFSAVVPALAVGAVAYGLSIFTYIYAQRYIGAARTSAYYAVAPFIAVLLSLVIFSEIPTWQFLIALAFMAVGAYLSSSDKPLFKHK